MALQNQSFEILAPRAFTPSNNEVIGGGYGRADEIVVVLSKFKNNKFEKLTHMPKIGAIGEFNFLTPNTKKAFNHLRLAFIKVLIL